MTKILLIAGVATLLVHAPATAGPWGEWDKKCEKLDREWKAKIIAAKKISETMRWANVEFNNSGRKNPKSITKWHSRVKRAAKSLLGWLKSQHKKHRKVWNADAVSKELNPAIDLMTRKMKDINDGVKKRGKRWNNRWSQGINGIPYGRVDSARRKVLAAHYCFYDLKKPRRLYRFEDWKTITGPGL